MRNGSQRGYTLIEVMLIVAIAAILAGIAIAAYQDSVRRERLAEVIDGATACKTLVTEYLASAEIESITAPRCDGPHSQYVGNFVVGHSGEIIIESAVPGAEGFFQLTPIGANGAQARLFDMPLTVSRWRCGPAPTSTGPLVDPRYLPGSCREDVSG
jgi:prepilin-type N-terminal cleavage/methylation domain-containing protein